MQHSPHAARAVPRRLILGAALALGLSATLVPDTGSVMAAGPSIVIVQGQTRPADAAPEPGPAASPPVPSSPAAPESAPSASSPVASPPAAESIAPAAPAAPAAHQRRVTVDDHTLVIEKSNKRVHVGGLGGDREYDSFEQFVQDAPWLAALVFLVVLMVFLVPLLIVVLLIWYKVRKNRMANETLLKLAERGVVPSAVAMDAVATGNAAAMAGAAAAAPAMPAYEQARALQRRVVWSDLRKGVILTGAGLGLTFFSMLDDGSPNSIGLILLFVGLGYSLLWFLEDHNRGPRDQSTPPPGGV